MLAYHNNSSVKSLYVNRFAAHRKADEVIQGQSFKNGRGCFVGCTLNEYSHDRFPVELGWPKWLAHLADTIFEGVPKSEAPQFGTDLLDAVEIGVDLEPLKNKFLICVQRRNLARLEGNDAPYAVQVRAAIEQAIAVLAEDKFDSARSAAESAWSVAWSAEARSAAWSARSAAWSAADSAAARSVTARSVAESARAAAESAWSEAESARSATGSAAARSAEYQLQRNDLLELIRNCEAAA